MTEDAKKQFPDKLLWLDLEMTGLEPEKDLILEVAIEVTDFNFKTLDSYEAIVKQPRQLVVKRMAENTWWQDYPANREQFLAKLGDAKSSSKIEHEIIDLIDKNFKLSPVILAGNSIHSDRKFIRRYWPSFDLKLHYRMLDVSAFKVLMQGKYALDYPKKEAHRAFDDIQASIAELQYYLDWLKP